MKDQVWDDYLPAFLAAFETFEDLRRVGGGRVQGVDVAGERPHGREPLGVPGEVTWRVPSLGADHGLADADPATDDDAAELFVERARRARPTLVIDRGEDVAAAVVLRPGAVTTPLGDDELDRMAAMLKALDVESVAVVVDVSFPVPSAETGPS